MFGDARDVDEMFNNNSEQQEKRREKNEPQLISKPPEENGQQSVSNSKLRIADLKAPTSVGSDLVVLGREFRSLLR
ncbi:hypothetical protein AWC38_SpisGene11801 [Stylophora pistillata]|uniref:Uncharacterized protein n=1 Tax=Stylophora pistillata TaxID=50429 RepID=A0A2B4S4X0_STYPI|nr:hypothetical protein AWC38_SpisGene11801 [Stylophora pistillata]